MENREVIVIGAGPAGSIASSLLRRAGHDLALPLDTPHTTWRTEP